MGTTLPHVARSGRRGRRPCADPRGCENGPHGAATAPGEYVARVAEAIGRAPAWVAARLEAGRPLGEAGTADAATRVARIRSAFLSDWHVAVGNWRARLAAIEKGIDPFDGGAAPAGARAALRSRALAELETTWHSLLDRAWRQAYRLGHATRTGEAPSVLTDRVLADIEKQKRFASKFARELAAGVPSQPGRMSVGNRSALYGNGITGAFNHGAVAAAAPDEVIIWQLGACDHCADCPVLAVSGPYTRDTLPTLPRNGDTECRMNCCCHLEFMRRPGQQVNTPIDQQTPFVDAAIRPPAPPPGFRLPTDAERHMLRDMEQRVNFARRKIAETAGTPAQRHWIAQRRAASKARRELLEQRGIWDPPKFDVGEVVRGANVNATDVRELTRVRGIDGRTVNRASAGARADALTGARASVTDALEGMPPTPGVPDIDDLLVRAGAPPELFRLPAAEAVEPPLPEEITINAVGWGGRAVVSHHLEALAVLGAAVYDVEVGPFGDEWFDLVLVAGTWITGNPSEVQRFVEAWLAAVDGPAPALARWQA